MRRFLLLALLPAALWAQSSGAPSYDPTGLVNAATNQAGPLAPNSLAILTGKNLSFNTVTADLTAGQLPVQITGAGVQVLFGGGTPAHLLYISPTQINFLVPGSRTAGNTTLTVVRSGLLGPTIPVTIADVAPGIFQINSIAVASHADNSLVTSYYPARASETIVVYCTGLGQTVLPRDSQDDGQMVPLDADPIATEVTVFSQLGITLNGVAIDPSCILWAGLTPGIAGMYSINLQLPATIDVNPEIRIWVGDTASPGGVLLAVQP